MIPNHLDRPDKSGTSKPSPSEKKSSTGRIVEMIRREFAEPTINDNQIEFEENGKPDKQKGSGNSNLADSRRSVPGFRLPVLKSIPYLLLVQLLFSLMYDFPGVVIQIIGLIISLEGILRITAVAGLIGFLTNWLAITMLFKPREKRPVIGQGLIPAHKNMIADKLADAIDRNLINPKKVREKLITSGTLSNAVDHFGRKAGNLTENEVFREEVYLLLTGLLSEALQQEPTRKVMSGKIVDHLDELFSSSRLETLVYKTYKNLRRDHLTQTIEGSLQKLPEIVYRNRHELDEFITSLPLHFTQNRDEIEKLLVEAVSEALQRIDFRTIIYENLYNYDEGRLETLIRDTTHEQLAFIKYLGAFFGFLGGLFIWNFAVAAIISSLIVLSILLADWLVGRLRTG